MSLSKVFQSPLLSSRIKSANVQNSERWLGYFLGPAFVMTMFYICGQTYLNMFYTDVLKMTPLMGGMFLVMLPVVSKILDAITNILMGQLIDRTKTKEGKARPWLLISAPLLVISGILLFTVPTANTTLQVIWVMFSYNFYFCIAFTMYNISHTLMVPLSTRNNKQRDTLAMLSSMGQSMIPGTIVSILFPALILPVIGVDQGKWVSVMSALSILMLPAILLEYYFTKERVTEETADIEQADTHTLKEQLKACFSSKYWIIIMVITLIYQVYNNFQVTSTTYYCNWVLGTYNDGITMTLVNAVGQAPLGFGILFLWPLVKKFGKRNVMISGFTLGIVGCVIGALNPKNMGLVMAGLMLKSIGQLPIMYTLLSMIADALDHVEWINKFRADGFSSSVYSIILTVSTGVSSGLFNLGLSKTGYVAPMADGSWVAQNSTVQNFFVSGLFVYPAICFALIAIIAYFFTVEKELPQIKADVVARHKAEAEARGETYLSPEEKVALEQAEFDRIAEEKRIEELKAKCAKKGLNFAEEEAKYQAKLAQQKAKKEKKPLSPQDKKKKRKKIILIVLITILAIILILGGITAYIIGSMSTSHPEKLPGNAEQYSVENAPVNADSPLAGKTIVFLGSSVVYGSDSMGESMADFIGKMDNVNVVKEAVSGTTLVDKEFQGKASYITRMKQLDPSMTPDAFVVQLSTNDATQKKPLGEISDSFSMDDFDTQTVTGAIEYIIAYVRETYNCPVVFFTGTKYDGQRGAAEYEAMVARLQEIQKKWDIGVIDLWNDPEMLSVSQEDYSLYMSNGIHPTRAGYRDWWTPKFESYLADYLG